MSDWQRRQAEFAELRELLVAEFADRLADAPTQLLAAYATRRGRYELWQAEDASAPELHLNADGRTRRVLDFTAEAADQPEFLLGDVALSEDGRWLAYTVDLDGSDRHQLRVVDLDDPAAARPIREGVGAPVGWHGGDVVFVELDRKMNPAVAALLSASGADYRVLWRAAAGEYLQVSQASDGRTVVLSCESHAGNRLLLLPPEATEPSSDWHSAPGDRLQYDAAGGLGWLVHTPAGGRDRLLLRRGDTDWQLCRIAPPEVQWDELSAVDGAALLVERHAGGQRLMLVDAREGGNLVEVDFGCADEPAGLALVPGLHAHDVQPLVVRSSWQAPARLYRVSTADRRALPVDPDPPATSAPPIRVLRLTAPSADGVEVPLTVLCPAGVPAPWPVVLYSYGAYGVPVDPYYMPFRFSLADRGIAFAVAHVRGGGELGQSWHDAGRQHGKLRAIQDYLGCAEYLIEQGWCPRDGLVARCRSAGAAVVGAALNQAPELFAAAVLEVPFVDCLRTLCDPDAALTELEWAEWGNPLLDAEARARISSWSPLDNVRPAPYPAMLITAGLADARVSPDGPRRYSEAIRAATTSGQPVYLKEDSSGHLGHSDISADWYGEAEVLAFILDRLGRRDHYVT
jgi:oligopeptidase B